ncbi:hypothetical protein [Nonomuraea dietziae]|uniref:galactose-binding domain-containing protein n=1 Tax=Nonomuraea dietziae TaxID=65515 RepID=UPI003CD0BD59
MGGRRPRRPEPGLQGRPPRQVGRREHRLRLPADFTVQVSADGSSWTTVATRTGYPRPGASAQAFSFTPVTARHVRSSAPVTATPRTTCSSPSSRSTRRTMNRTCRAMADWSM